MSDFHHQEQEKIGFRLLVSILLNIGITAFQTLGFFISGSLSLLSDAMHNFTDVFSLVISWFASKMMQRAYSKKATFGYVRSEVLAAFINTIILLLIAAFLIKEAIERFWQPETLQSIDTKWIIWGTLVSIVGNFLSVLVLYSKAKDNINVKSSYLHLLSDLMSSLAILLGGIIMYYTQWMWIDGLLSILIAVYLLWISFKLLGQTYNILMQFSPVDVKEEDIQLILNSIPEIKNIHHLHIWEMTSGRTMLMAHVDFYQNIDLKQANELLDVLASSLKEKYQIFEVNLQAEFDVKDDKSLINQSI
ncbi:MAG: cation transporter [Bacteroidales bacterium]|nr:cation transporter [Bacteroidales bacterium]